MRKVALDLGIYHSSLYKTIQDGSNVGLERIEGFLNLFGFGRILGSDQAK